MSGCGQVGIEPTHRPDTTIAIRKNIAVKLIALVRHGGLPTHPAADEVLTRNLAPRPQRLLNMPNVMMSGAVIRTRRLQDDCKTGSRDQVIRQHFELVGSQATIKTLDHPFHCIVHLLNA